MNSRAILTRLSGLLAELNERLGEPRWRFVDAPVGIEYFARYEPLRDSLRSRHPDLFGDIPVRARPTSSGTSDFDGRGYISRNTLQQLSADIKYVLHVATEIPEDAQGAVKVSKEGVFFAGERFDALTRIADIFASAKTSVALIDGYVGKDTLDLLTVRPKGVPVHVLTQALEPPVLVLANAFKQQHGPLEIRTSRDFHDRFVIIDDIEFYHFGASIKDLGRRGFMFSLIEEPDVVAGLRGKFAAVWASASVLV
jgi:hypothetical protein